MTPLAWYWLVSASTPAAAAAEPAAIHLTLDEAFARALSANLAVGRATAEVETARAQKSTAFSFVLPRIVVNGSATRNSEEVTFGSDEDVRTILPRNDWSLRATLTQPIFAAFREKRVYDQAKAGIVMAMEGVRASKDVALLSVAADYLAVVQSDALLDVEARGLELARNRRNQAADLYEAGETTRVGVLRADGGIKAAERRVIAARRARETAAGRLRVNLVLDGSLAVEEPELDLPPLADEATLASRALVERPEVLQAEQAVRVARLEVQKQKGAYFPVVTADAGYILQKTSFPKDEYGYAALRVTVPIFQGQEVGARVSAARHKERQATLALEETRRRVTEEVRTARMDAEAAVESLSLAEQQLEAAEAEYEQAFDLYRSQESTALELEAAENGLVEARRAVVVSRLDRKLAELRVWYAAGSLKSAVSKEVVP